MPRSVLPNIELPSIEGWPSPIAVWQHAGQSGQFQVRIDLVRGAGRRDAVPDATLAYETGSSNSIFGLGWSLKLAAISRGNGRHLPRYRDSGPDSDTFSAVDLGELIPILSQRGGRWQSETRTVDGLDVTLFRPRVESGFARVERRADPDTGDSYWVTVSRDNVERVFGRSVDTRIVDPADHRRIARWLLEEECDSRGHCVQYEYKREDLTGVDDSMMQELHRLGSGCPEPTLHIKRIKWGNARPFEANDWLFELVFDYGEHDADAPTPVERFPWALRPDAFSSYRTGFELRTRRLCKRVLFFHHIGSTSYLVRAHELSYDSTPDVSLLLGVTLRSYRHDAGERLQTETLPTTRFEYNAVLPPGPVREVAYVGGRSASSALVSAQQWLDLDGIGLPGLVSREPGGAVYYRPNRGDGLLGRPVVLPTRPSLTDATVNAAQTFGRPFGDSRNCLVDLSTGPGYQERMRGGGWLPYMPFPEVPTMPTSAVGTRNVDLDGDGRADLMLAGEFGPRWHPFEGRDGWAPAREIAASRSTWGALADQTGTVMLADMDGDGLSDLVEIKPGSVRYWPNLGQGRFGEPVRMANAPMVDGPDLFDPARVRLVDVDGFGTADLVYLGREAVTWYPNRSGNSFGPAQENTSLPAVTDLDSIEVIDLLGTGTGCLIWSSVAPISGDRPLRYVELVGGQRPHMLKTIRNGQGIEVEISYTPSTRMMLDDAAAGNRWHSTLPSPLWVVNEIRETDLTFGATHISTWSYRHAYYDDVSRESRGFAYVGRRDLHLVPNDPIDPALSAPVPLRETRTWYHTGAFDDRIAFETELEAEFFTAGDTARRRPALEIEDDIGVEPRELLRALQGRPVREEVYEIQALEPDAAPYTAVDYGYLLRTLQPKSLTASPSIAIFPREEVQRTYERQPIDPRVTHRLAFAFDEFGSAARQVTIAYPRRHPDYPEQAKMLATLEERDVVNRDDASDWYRVGVPVAHRVFELGPLPSLGPDELFRVEDFEQWEGSPSLRDLPFEQSLPETGPLQRRLVSAVETLYWDETLAAAAPPGTVNRLSLVHHERRAAFTPGRLETSYSVDVPDRSRLEALGYEFDHGLWWARGSQITYDASAFYQPSAERTPLGADYNVIYDAYHLFVAETHDPAGNVQRADYDYQALAALTATDANGATLRASFDAFGLPVAIAADGAHAEGDTLAEPTTVIVRDPLTWQLFATPASLRISMRTQHRDPASLWEQRVIYLDGRSRVMQRKRLAEPAPGDTAPRWIVESYVVATTDGTPLRSYASGFTPNDGFSPEPTLTALPVTHLRVDALGQAIETRRADGALARTVRTAWRIEHWDSNDSVLGSDWLNRRRRPGATRQETIEAEAVESHVATPTVEHLDSAGRAFLQIENGGAAGLALTRTALATGGEVISITDPRGIIAERRMYDMLGRLVRIRSTASGDVCTLYDAEDEPAHIWGARGQEQRLYRDGLGRLVRREVRSRGGRWRVAELWVWGEVAPGADGYRRGRLYLHYDGAGQLKIPAYDFHGNPLRTERTFRANLTVQADWSSLTGAERAEEVERAAVPLLTRESLPTLTTFDAQSRLLSRNTPDGSRMTCEYGLRGLPFRISVTVAGRTTDVLQTPVYDAGGRRINALLGNGVRETSVFDEATGFLTRRTTLSPDGSTLRDLGLSYDPVGNVLGITDAGQQTLYFRNAVVSPDRVFRYDPLYRLIEARGREAAEPPPPSDLDSIPPVQGVPHRNDLRAVRSYVENYQYDLAGNLEQLTHSAGSEGSWNTRYEIDPTTDRVTGLLRTNGSRITSTFTYDDAGNALTLGSLTGFTWNDDEQLAQVNLGGGGTVYYAYDGNGQRAAKVIVRLDGTREERLYLEGYERHRRLSRAGGIREETLTLHVEDGEGRLLLVERRRAAGDLAETILWRYQHADQIGSCWLETNQRAQILSFEEFRPFGTPAYRAAPPATPPKRYRFGGQENDTETGFNYHGARYYAPWMCRWISADPSGMADGTNRYAYCRNNPTTFSDPTGLQVDWGHMREPQFTVTDPSGQPLPLTLPPSMGGSSGTRFNLFPTGRDAPPAPPVAPTTSHPHAHSPHSHRSHRATPTAVQSRTPPAATPEIELSPIVLTAPAPQPTAPSETELPVLILPGIHTGPVTREEIESWARPAPSDPLRPPGTQAPGHGSRDSSGRVDIGIITGNIGVGIVGVTAGIGMLGLALAFPIIAPLIAIFGLSLFAMGWGEAYQARLNESWRAGQLPSSGWAGAVALGDAVGGVSFWEAYTRRSAITGQQLSDDVWNNQVGNSFATVIGLASSLGSLPHSRLAARVQRWRDNRAAARLAQFAPELAEIGATTRAQASTESLVNSGSSSSHPVAWDDDYASAAPGFGAPPPPNSPRGRRRVLVVGESETFEYSGNLARQNPDMEVVGTCLDPNAPGTSPANISGVPNLWLMSGVDATQLHLQFTPGTFTDIIFNAPRAAGAANRQAATRTLINNVLRSSYSVLPPGGSVRFSGRGRMPGRFFLESVTRLGQRRLTNRANQLTLSGIDPPTLWPSTPPPGYSIPSYGATFLSDPVFGVPYTPMRNEGTPIGVTVRDLLWYVFTRQ